MVWRYFEVLFSDCFGKQYVSLISTTEESPYSTKYSFATGFNGCKIVDFKETTREDYRFNNKKFFKPIRNVLE